MADDELMEECQCEEGGAPEWMVTFGDMMSLLLTFFIMLLSMSTMDVVKYRQVVESLTGAFGASIKETAQYEKAEKITEKDIKTESEAIQKITEELAKMVQDSQLQKFVKVGKKGDSIIVTGKITETKKQNEMSKLIAQLNSVIQSEKMSDMVKVVVDKRGVAVRIKDKSLFKSGDATVQRSSMKILYKIGKIIKKHKGTVLIEGHTDDIPIHNRKFASNWELSAARAASVARFIIKYAKVDKKKLRIVGLADTQPLVPNTSAENRAKNRRVEFIFMK